MTATTVDPTTLEAQLAAMTADQLDHLAATSHARAVERRKVITVQEARSVFDIVPDIPGWTWLGFEECGRIRKACEVLIAWQRLHPEQIVSPMTEVALKACSHWGAAAEAIAREAVAAGICDGQFALAGGDDGD